MEDDEDPQNYIGNPTNCKIIKVKIKDFILSKGEDLHLSQIKFFFNRNQIYLIAIQFIFQTKEIFGNKDPSTFVSFEEKDTNKYLGVLANYSPLSKNFINNVEEYNLYFAFGEEIFSFSGEYTNESFHKINIKTNFGKFFIIGNQKIADNFNFKFLNNKIFFGGLIIGVSKNKISCLKPIFYEDKEKFEQEKLAKGNEGKKELIDISEDMTFLKKVQPIYKTNVNGVCESSTTVIDDMEKSGLIKEIKNKKAALSEIKIFSNDKRITRIDTLYTVFEDKSKNVLIQHESQEYKESNKYYVLKIDDDDYINKAVMFISKSKKFLRDIELITKKGKKIRTFKDRPKYFRELKATSDKELRILGMVIGYEKYVQFVQFYYQLKNFE